MDDILLDEHNPYRANAIYNAIRSIEFEYNERWLVEKLSYIVIGSFTWNIDKKLGRRTVDFKKDEIWIAPEYADDECLNNIEEKEHLYKSINKALVHRLLQLDRMARKLKERIEG
jgi:hypothetical protein